MRYRHIIWDWNGTLLDDTWLCVEVLNGLLERRDRAPIDLATYRAHFNFPVVEFYDFLGFAVDGDSFETISREFIGDYEKRWLECGLHPETDTILESFRGTGVTHSMLSAAQQSALETGARHFGIAHHFERLVGQDNIHALGKVEAGRRLIDTLHWDPNEVLLVGDTLHDHEVARAMAVDCLLLEHGHHPRERLQTSGAPVRAGLDAVFRYVREGR